MLLMTSPTLPTTAAKTNTPMRNVRPVKMYSCVNEQRHYVESLDVRVNGRNVILFCSTYDAVGESKKKETQCQKFLHSSEM